MELALATTLGSVAAAEIAPKRRHTSLLWRLAWPALGAALVLVAAALVVYRPLTDRTPLGAHAAFYRMREGTEDRLLPGGRVRPGDRLFMELEGQEKMYAYVLNEDEAGKVFVLFPAGLDLDNPLPPNVRHRLPGRQDGRQTTWEVTSAGGKEQFLVIASRRPLRELDRDLSNIPRVERGRPVVYAPVGSQSVRILRGVGGLAEVNTVQGGQAKSVLTEIAATLSGEAQKAGGLWVWEIQLDNPAP